MVTSFGVNTEWAFEQMVDIGRDFFIQAGVCVLEHNIPWNVLQGLFLLWSL